MRLNRKSAHRYKGCTTQHEVLRQNCRQILKTHKSTDPLLGTRKRQKHGCHIVSSQVQDKCSGVIWCLLPCAIPNHVERFVDRARQPVHIGEIAWNISWICYIWQTPSQNQEGEKHVVEFNNLEGSIKTKHIQMKLQQRLNDCVSSTVLRNIR